MTKYRLSQLVDDAMVTWVRENCTEDGVTFPSVIWSHSDAYGGTLNKPQFPFVVLDILSLEDMTGSTPESTWTSEDKFNLSYEIKFVLSINYYDNREDSGFMKVLLRLKQSLKIPSVIAKLNIAGVSFLQEVSKINNLSFIQPAGSQLRSQCDLSFSYIDVVSDVNIGYIERVRDIAEITTEKETVYFEQEIPQ